MASSTARLLLLLLSASTSHVLTTPAASQSPPRAVTPLSESDYLALTRNPLQYSFKFCEENLVYPNECIMLIRDVLDVLSNAAAHDDNHSSAASISYTVQPHFRIPIYNTERSEPYSLEVYHNQRVEDAVDDFLTTIYSPTSHNLPPNNIETMRAMCLSALCTADNLFCDGLPPRDIIGVWTFFDQDYHATPSSADDYAKDIQYVHRYYIRAGYDMHHHVLHICSLVQYSSFQCQSKSTYIAEHITQEIRLYEKYKGKDDNIVGISIGHDCGAAYIGTQYNFRKRKREGYLTGPFDLLESNYDGVLQCLEDDFKYFLDSDYLQVVEVVNEYDFPIHNNGELQKGDKIVINTKYRFGFVHESPFTYAKLSTMRSYFGGHLGDVQGADSVAEHWSDGAETFIRDDFKRLKKRFQPRIENWRRYMASGKLINFLMHTMFDPHAFPRLDAVMKRAYPLTDYKVTVIPAHVVKYSKTIFWNDVLNISTVVVEF